MLDDPFVLGRPARREKLSFGGKLETIGKLLIAAFTMLMLMSLGGGQFVTAPFLLPALWWAFRSSGRWGRAGLAFLAGLMGLEFGWLIAYSIADERPVPMWFATVLGFVGTVGIFYLSAGRSRVRQIPFTDHGDDWRRFDLIGILGFLLAASMTAATVYKGFIFYNSFDAGFVRRGALACAGAWAGFWFWRQRRWMVAASAFPLVLLWPFGRAAIPTAIISMGIAITSMARGVHGARTG